jgi:hypothetical protein
MSVHAISAVLARTRYVLLLTCFASCTGSPAVLAMRPAFEVATPRGVTSVSIRQSPIGTTDGEFSKLVKTGMERAGYRLASSDQVRPPYPSQRIVWHVNPDSPRPIERLVVNVFDGGYPYAYEEDTLSNDESPEMITYAIESMSRRLLGDIVAQANAKKGLDKQA